MQPLIGIVIRVVLLFFSENKGKIISYSGLQSFRFLVDVYNMLCITPDNILRITTKKNHLYPFSVHFRNFEFGCGNITISRQPSAKFGTVSNRTSQ